MMIRVLSSLVSLAVALMAGAGLADDWPQFKRDAARTGDNPQAVLAFPLQRTTAVRFPAPIYASPAVVAGRVYVQDARGHAAAIDSRSNRVLWQTSLGGVNNTSSPAVADGKVYLGSTAGAFYILDADTGEVLKKISAAGGVITAPAVTDEAVYFSTFGGKLHKLDRSGESVWTFDGGRTSITEFAVDGTRIVFFAGTDEVVLYQLEDLGDEVRVASRHKGPRQCSPVGGPLPLPQGLFAYQSYDSEYGRFCLADTIVLDDSNDSRAVPSLRGDRFYRGDRCWTLKDGKAQRAWRVDPSVLHDGGWHSSPALGRDVLVVGSEQGTVYAFPLEGTETVRRPVWSFDAVGAGRPNGAVSSSPAVVDGGIFFGGEDGILYGLGTGPEAAVVDLPAAKTADNRPGRQLTGPEWPTVGGDAGFSCVAPETALAPPLRVRWQTRVWSTFKAPMIVAESKVFASGRMGPLMALDADTGEILWKTHHPSVESRAAPTYADGHLYLMRVQGGLKESPYVRSWSGSTGGAGVWCHDAKTGEVVWHQPMEFAYHFNPDALPVHAGKVFTCRTSEEGQIEALALDAATGEIVWSRPLLEPASGKPLAPRRFAGVIAEGLWCVSVNDVADRRGGDGSPGTTVALRPESGEIVWRNDDVSITVRTRIAARNGTLVVFNNTTGAHALDARTGREMWQTPNPFRGNFYMHALTDLYLDSQGERGRFNEHQCSYQIHINGLWYSHGPTSSNWQHAKQFSESGKPQIVWKRSFLSNACPSASPAYGYLYFAPNGEGVVYCFENGEDPVEP